MKKLTILLSLITVISVGSGQIHASKAPAKPHSASGKTWDDLMKAIRAGDLKAIQKIVPSQIKPWHRTKGSQRSILQVALEEAPSGKGIVRYLRNNMDEKRFYSSISATEVALIKNLIAKRNAEPSASATTSSIKSHSQPQTITFYDQKDPYYEFTNFYNAPFNLDGKTWPTSEHYFQAQKFNRQSKIMDEIRTAKTPREAFNLAKKYQAHTRADWHNPDPNPNNKGWNIKDTIMCQGLRAKFTQHPKLKASLIGTGNAQLIEASDIDPYWGWGRDRKGANKLGQLLMALREEFKSQTTSSRGAATSAAAAASRPAAAQKTALAKPVLKYPAKK